MCFNLMCEVTDSSSLTFHRIIESISINHIKKKCFFIDFIPFNHNKLKIDVII